MFLTSGSNSVEFANIFLLASYPKKIAQLENILSLFTNKTFVAVPKSITAVLGPYNLSAATKSHNKSTPN